MTTRVLVTGGAGYIGSHTAKALAVAGFEPVVLDSLVTGHRELVRWGPFVQADIADSDAVRRCLKEYRIEAVLHFAALIAVGESVVHPRRYYENNTLGTLRLLSAMLDEGIGHFVFSSTAAVYGNPSTTLIRETHPRAPINPYGVSKAAVEFALEDYARAYPLRSVMLRYFNAAGADPDGETGEMHEPETHLLPLVIETALGRRACIDVFGTDYETKDGTAVRDYVHVSDLADAHVRALRYLLDGGETIALNLGTGEGSSVREVIASVERVTGKKVPWRERARREGDPPVLVADSEEAKRRLRWTPSRSELDVIVRTALRWHERGIAKAIVPPAARD